MDDFDDFKYLPRTYNIRLGRDDLMAQLRNAEQARRGSNYTEKPKGKWISATCVIAVCIVLVLVTTGGFAVAYAVSEKRATTISVRSPTATNSPTNSPVETIRVPSPSPTHYPSRSPTKTMEPSPSPTPLPTSSPFETCKSFSEVCGCNKVVGTKQDILWIVDESRSIGYNNYLLVQQAIREVARNFTLGFNMTRMGVIEYDAEVNDEDTIDFTDYQDSESFASHALMRYNCDPVGNGKSNRYCRCGTDTTGALIRAREFLSKPENALRDESNRVLVILSDGEPCCRQGQDCCRNQCESTRAYGISPKNKAEEKDLVINKIRELREQFDFSLVYVPLRRPGASNNLPPRDAFGYADKAPFNGLQAHEFTVTDYVDIPELIQFFLDSPFKLPLPPCVTPPPTAFLSI